MTCRIAPDRLGVNMVKLQPRITEAPCTSQEITTEVTTRGSVLSPSHTVKKVVYANSSADLDVPPFALPGPGTVVVVKVAVKCERGGTTKAGQDTCQVPE